MATEAELVDKLSKRIGDYQEFTTTSTGLATTIVSTDIGGEDNDNFITPDHTWFKFTDGTLAGEEKLGLSKSGNTITLADSYSSTTPSGATVQKHALFSGAQKATAINDALDELYPLVHRQLVVETTLVADQYLYDISGSGFFNDTPHQVWLQDDVNTNLTSIYRSWAVDWNSSGAPRLRIFRRPEAGRILVLIGIRVPTLGSLLLGEEDIVVAQAAFNLFNGAVQRQPGDVAARFQRAADYWERKLRTEKAIKSRRQPNIHQPMEWVSSGEFDTNFL